jgi:hypothetical protein
MLLSDVDVQVVMAALRMASMGTEAQARAALAGGRKTEAQNLGAFSTRCAQLSDEFEKGAKRPAIFKPS